MGITIILIEALALSADAFAVSVCKGLAMRRVNVREAMICGLWFGIFQGLMPFFGYLLGTGFEKYVRSAASIIAFVILTLIGAKMIKESFAGDEKADPRLNAKAMLLMSIATSIDAFAVGVALALEPVILNSHISSLLNIFCACAVICLVTFITCFAGVKLGNIFGARHKSKAETAGGAALILIAIIGLFK